MVKCNRCNVTIKDNTKVCPLCNCVLEKSEQEGEICGYPKIYFKRQGMKFVSNIMLTFFLVMSIVLVALNLILRAEQWWCVISVVGMVYTYLMFKTVFVSTEGYRLKVFQTIIMTLGLLLIIDMATNFHGWSLNFVLPSTVLILDLVSIILMIVNRKSWESYLIMQIIALGLSLLPLLLWILAIVTTPIVAFVAIIFATLTFFGTLIIGDFTAIGELKRRFHIR